MAGAVNSFNPSSGGLASESQPMAHQGDLQAYRGFNPSSGGLASESPGRCSAERTSWPVSILLLVD